MAWFICLECHYFSLSDPRSSSFSPKGFKRIVIGTHPVTISVTHCCIWLSETTGSKGDRVWNRRQPSTIKRGNADQCFPFCGDFFLLLSSAMNWFIRHKCMLIITFICGSAHVTWAVVILWTLISWHFTLTFRYVLKSVLFRVNSVKGKWNN